MRGRILLYFLVAFTMSCSLGNPTRANNSVFNYPPSALPSLIVAYNLAMTQYEDFDCLWRLKGDQHKSPFPLLETKLNKISPNINVSFGFTHTAFIVQNDMKGLLMGFSSRKNKGSASPTIPFENILFVTTPIESFRNRCLVFLSSVSPQCTYILAIDKDLVVELLYSTFDGNLNRILEKNGYTTMCSILSIEVREPGVFVLSERENNKCAMSGEERTFRIDVTKGNFRISRDTVKP